MWISEFGGDNDVSNQAEGFRTALQVFKALPVEGIFAYMWRSDDARRVDPEPPGVGYNICADAETGLGMPSYYVFLDQLSNSTIRPSG